MNIALEAAYRVGSVVVENIIENWLAYRKLSPGD